MALRKISLILLCIVCLFSCKKDLNVAFNVSQSTTFTIPPSSPLSILNLVSPAVSTNWDQDFTNNNANVNKIVSMNLTNLQLTITSPSGQTFGFLQSISIYLSAPGLSKVEIAQLNPVPSNSGSVIALNVDNVDLSAYAKQSSFTLSFSTTTNQSTTTEIDMRADMVFHIVANPLN